MESNSNLVNDEPATLAGPAGYEEELKDYSKKSDDEVTENLPKTSPEPRPSPNTSINT